MSSKRPKLPWKIRFFIFVNDFIVNLTRGPNGTVKCRYFNLIDRKSPPSKKSINGVKSEDIIVDAARDLWFRLYVPTNPDSDINKIPTIVYFHGGGFQFSSASTIWYDNICRKISRDVSANVISVNYRLAPEHRFPTQYDDGFDVLKFIDENDCFEDFGNVNLSRCFISGDSAGGNLAHHVAVKASGHKFNRLSITGLILIQPFFGGEERTESEIELVGAPILSVELTDWMWKNFLPDGSDRDHPAVNVFGPNSMDISGVQFPATLVIIGGFDPLKDWQRKYVEGLKNCGKQVHVVEYPNGIHGFYAFPELPEAASSIADIKSFITKTFA